MAALAKSKPGKAVGPYTDPIEVWKAMGCNGTELLTRLFQRILHMEKMPDQWRESVILPIYKQKRGVQSCNSNRGIKIMSHTLKLWERVVENRLRQKVSIADK